MSSSKNPKEEFRYVKEGTGGTLAICKNDTRRIGVIGCNTSVGVYFKIDSERVFCAHIQCTSGKTKPLSEPSKVQVDRAREQVVNKLITIAAQEEWRIDRESFGHDLIVVCRHANHIPKGGEEQRYLSWYVGQGVSDFFFEVARQLAGKHSVLSLPESRWTARRLRDLPKREIDGAIQPEVAPYELPADISLVLDQIPFKPPWLDSKYHGKSETFTAGNMPNIGDDSKTSIGPAITHSNERGRSESKEIRSRSPTPKRVNINPDAEWAMARAEFLNIISDCNGFLVAPSGNQDILFLGTSNGKAIESADIKLKGHSGVRQYEALPDGEWSFSV
jgi:hypothetical protein